MQITQEEKNAFCEACDKFIEKERIRKGIGTLSEKTTHAVVKNYIVPKEKYHEIACEGYVADILYEGEVIEIQTANFNTLRRKLDAFLPKYEVTIVYPIPSVKWLIWIDEQSGEITNKRKSPKTGSYYQAFYELYKIKSYLTNPHLHFRFLLIDMEEYRLLNGWSSDKKKGSSRYDRIPIELKGELMIAQTKDFAQLVPELLQTQFTSADYAKHTKLKQRQAQTALNVLTHLKIVSRVGKKGNSIVYERAIMANEEKLR